MWQILRQLFNPRDAYGAEQTLLLFTYLLGLTPFRLRGQAKARHFQLSRLGYLNALLQLSFFGYCFLSALIQQQSIVGYFFNSPISQVGDSLQKFIGMMGMFTLFLCSGFRVRLLMRLCDLIAHIDDQLLNVGVCFNYARIMTLRHTHIVLISGVQLAYLGSSTCMLLWNDVRPSYPAAVSFYVPQVFLLSVVLLFGAILHRSWQHFEALNKFNSTRCSYAMGLLGYLDRVVHPQNVYDCYRVTFGLALFFGIMPYCIDSSVKGRLHLSYFGLSNIIVRMCFYTLNFFYSCLERRSMMTSLLTTNVSGFTADLEMFNGMFGIMAVLVASLLNRQDLKQLLALFDGLECEAFPRVGINFKQLQAAKKINGLAGFLLCSLFLFVSYSIIIILPDSGFSYVSYSAIISYFSPNFIVCAVCILISGLLIKLGIYLSALNEVLKNLAHQWDTRSIKAVEKQRSLQCLDSFSMYTIVTKDPAEIIQESMEIHHLICEAAATANKYFTYQLLTIISIAFLIIVFDAYYVLETLLGKSKRESKFKTVEFVTFFSCQMILYLIAIISIVEGSNRAIKKSEKTGGIVHSLLNKTKSAEVREKLQQFSMQLMHLKINFTAAGLFNIDRTLYFTISGALTTYLIILLQFTSSSPGNEKPNSFDCCEALHNVTNHTASLG